MVSYLLPLMCMAQMPAAILSQPTTVPELSFLTFGEWAIDTRPITRTIGNLQYTSGFV